MDKPDATFEAPKGASAAVPLAGLPSARVGLAGSQHVLVSLAAILPKSVALALSWPMDPRFLHPAERAAIAHAVVERQREFAGGRSAAAQAQRKLGLSPKPVLMGQDRAPLWPQGLVGSISHCNGLCLAAVARQEAIAALGIDLERDQPLAADLLPVVLRPEEAGLPSALVFSAKEALFKALYPIVQSYFDFSAASVREGKGHLIATLAQTLGPWSVGSEFPIRFWRGEGFVATAVVLE